MFNIKRNYFILLIFILLLGGVYYINNTTKSKGNPLDVYSSDSSSEVSVINIFNGTNGKEIKVDKKSDITRIIQNLNAIDFEKDKSSKDFDGFGVSINIYNAEGKLNKSFAINSTDTINYNDYFYVDKNKSIDYEFIKGLFEEYKTIN